MKTPLKYFGLFTALSSFLFFINQELFISVFYSIVFFTLLWFIINRLTSILSERGIEPIMTSLALNIGFKFFSSLTFVFTMYLKNWFKGTATILIFILKMEQRPVNCIKIAEMAILTKQEIMHCIHLI